MSPLFLAATLFFGGDDEINVESVVDQPVSHILHGDSAELAADRLGAAGGPATYDLDTTRGIAAQLTRSQFASLAEDKTCESIRLRRCKGHGYPEFDTRIM